MGDGELFKYRPFSKCPYPTCTATPLSYSLNVSNCSKGAVGVLCGQCEVNHIRDSLGGCAPCTPASAGYRAVVLVVLLTFVLLVCLMIHVCRRRIRELRQRAEKRAERCASVLEMGLEYGGDSLKIICVFAQISSTAPRIIDLPVPPLYQQFLENFAFVNFDFMKLMGLECLGPLDYRAQVGLACAMPSAVVLCGFTYWCWKTEKCVTKEKKRTTRAASDEEQRAAIAALFDIVDADGSGFVDVHEFRVMLKELGHTKLNIEQTRAIMQKTVGIEAGEGEGATSATPPSATPPNTLRIGRELFVASALSGEIADTSPDAWVKYLRNQRNLQGLVHLVYQMLSLIHAPVSVKLFDYFSCREVGTMSFLNGDYGFRCNASEHEQFATFVWVYIFGFTFALPTAIGCVLIQYRNRLEAPKTQEMFGFLYLSYRPGREWWDIHELLRRVMLTGVVVFFPSVLRLTVSLLISILASWVLIGMHPHKALVLQRLEQGSFMTLTLKYTLSVLLQLLVSNEEVEFLGWLFVVLDLLYIGFSLMCFVAILRKMWEVAAGSDEVGGEGGGGGGEGTTMPQRVVSSRWKLLTSNTALEHATATRDSIELQERATTAAFAKKQTIQRQRTMAQQRLQKRIKRQKRIKNRRTEGSTGSTVQVVHVRDK